MAFNFSLNETSAIASTRRNLTPFAVHTVKFTGAEIKSGTSKSGNEYKLLAINFENNEGVANMSIFWPTEADGVRGEREAKDGHKYETPSNWDQTKAVIAQTLQVLNPTGYEKFIELSSKFKNFDQMAEAFTKLVNKATGTETNVKFTGYTNKDGYMQLTFPRIVNLRKVARDANDDRLFISDNYIGKDVTLSPYEMKKAAELNTIKPSEMKADPEMDTVESTDDISLDLENL